MTVQNQNVKNVYRGNGSATVFPFTFAINKEHPEYIHVYITNDGDKAVETNDFTCDMDTKTITYPKTTSSAAKLSSTQRLTIYRLLPYTQELNLVNQGPFFAEDVETELDDLEMQIQQQKEESGRSLQVGLEVESFDTTIPVAAGKTFRVKDDGTGFELTEDPAVAHAAAVGAQEAAERAQGAAETAQGKAEEAQEEAETAKDAAEIIATQIDIMARALIYNSVAAMKADTTLVAGMTAGTKGYNGVNDGNGAAYTIRLAKEGETGDDQNTIMLDNGNVAEKIKTNAEILSGMIDEIDLNRSPWMLFKQFDGYTATQGMCIAGKYLIESAHERTELDGRLYVIDIDNKSVVGYTDGVRGHMNSICYDANHKVVCVADGYTVHRYGLSNEGTLTYIDDVTAPISVTGISCNNDLYYLRNANLIIVSADIVTERRRFNFEEPAGGFTRQGMNVDDNYLYMSYTGDDHVERLHIGSKEDGKLLKVLTFPRGTFGEFEESAIRDGYLYINLNRPFRESMLGVYKIPLYKSIINVLDDARGHIMYQQASETQNYYVDNTNDIAFPDGTQDNPYNVFACAVTLYSLNASVGCVYVKGTYDALEIRNLKNIRLDLADAVVGAINVYRSYALIDNINAKQILAERSTVILTEGTLDWSYAGTVSVNAPIVNYRSVICGIIRHLKNSTIETVQGNYGLTNIEFINQTNSAVAYTSVSNTNTVIINNVLLQRWNAVTAGSNLNDYTLPGYRYYCVASRTDSLTNCPTSENFVLESQIRSTENMLIQRILTASGTVYVRYQSNATTWSSWNKICHVTSGSTTNRPTADLVVGEQYFDTTINKPIWWNGTAWVDATGAVV